MGDASAVIGVDIGTTSAKAVAFDESGAVVASAAAGLPLAGPLPDRAEQDPEEVRDATLRVLADAIRQVTDAEGEVEGLAFGGAMHSLVALARDGRPLTPAITFADNRAAAQAERLRHTSSGRSIHLRTGTPIHPMSPLAKLVWFRERDRQTFEAAARWVSLKEYVLLRLFGESVVDHSIAAATGLLNLERLDWDAETLDLVGLDRERLSPLVPTTEVRDDLAPQVARELGLRPDMPVVIGASDGVLANLGVGAIDPDTAVCTIGTSGAVRAMLPEPRADPDGRLFCYPLTEERWVVGGAINNGGIVLQWARDQLLPLVAQVAEREGRDAYEAIIALAEEVPAGSDGLIALPYLTGERAPHWGSSPRGVVFGLRRHHGRGHIVRALHANTAYAVMIVNLARKHWRLPHRQRAAIVLRFYEHLSEHQTAELLQCSPKAVRSLVGRAKESLRQSMQGALA
jgi:gluconokinase